MYFFWISFLHSLLYLADPALIISVKCNRTDMIASILHQGGDPNVPDSHGFNALHHAINYLNVDIVNFVVQNSLVPLDLAARDPDGCTPLVLAAKHTCCKFVEILLKSKTSTSAQYYDGKNYLESRLY